MGAFRKRVNSQFTVPVGETPMVTIPVTKVVSTKENPEPTTYVEMKTMSVDEHAKRLGMPKDEDYQLRDMIASGRIPEEVPVGGMLNSNDPLDLSNSGVGDAILSQLSEKVDSKPAGGSAAAAPVDTPSE